MPPFMRQAEMLDEASDRSSTQSNKETQEGGSVEEEACTRALEAWLSAEGTERRMCHARNQRLLMALLNFHTT
jgi:hypothetical protein